MEGTEILINAIKKGELHYYRATGNTAYVAEYEDGEMQIVFNHLSAKAAKPNSNFVLVASAKWEDNQGYPSWGICDADDELFAVISTDLDGKIDDDVFYV